MKNSPIGARSAFTVVELMVVLAIIALLSAITLGIVSSLREGGKRGTCQTNLNQIYGAMRLYSQDFDGQFPYFNPAGGPTSPQTPGGGLVLPRTPADGLGLWALYAYPPGAANGDCNGLPTKTGDPLKDAPLAAYLKSPRVFHCPNDDVPKVDACTSTPIGSAQLDFDPTGSGVRRLNPFFLSYQTTDDAPTTPTYTLFRGDGVKRQLRFYHDDGTGIKTPERRSPDQTVVTWCRFHRHLNADGTTKAGDNSLDNVLFLDGSVQSIRVTQAVTNTSGVAKTCVGANRLPLNIASAPTDACN